MTDTLTPEMLRTAAKVAELKGYDGTRRIYTEEAEELEKKLSEASYIDELAENALLVWRNDNVTGEYWVSITKAVVAKLTHDGHLNLEEPVKVEHFRDLNTRKNYVDVDGDKVQFIDNRWQRYDPVNAEWYPFYTDSYAPYTLVQ